MWQVEFTDDFGGWWDMLSSAQQTAIDASVRMLEQLGPHLSRPHADTVKGSRLANLKELRVQCRGRPVRIFFAFDPRRHAILLIGGDKTGDGRFYERMIPLAEQLYERYLGELRKEGLIP